MNDANANTGQNPGDTNPADQNQNTQPPAQQASGTTQPTAGQGAQGSDAKPGSGQLQVKEHIFKIPPHPNTEFDEENFLTLLEGSISLTMEEKKRVIDAIPRLKMEQINELITIFEEEKQKFAELEKEFASDVQKLKAEREKEIEVKKSQEEEASEAEEEAAQAEELKKNLGL